MEVPGPEKKRHLLAGLVGGTDAGGQHKFPEHQGPRICSGLLPPSLKRV